MVNNLSFSARANPSIKNDLKGAISAGVIAKVVLVALWILAAIVFVWLDARRTIEAGHQSHTGMANLVAVAAFTSVLAGSFVAGLAGFAFSAIAGALLFHWLPPIEAVPLLLACSITTQLLSVTELWHIMQWRRCTPFLLGGIMGIPIGEKLLAGLSPHSFAAGFGALLICYSLYMLSRPNLSFRFAGHIADLAAGFAGGITGGATAFPGAIPTVWCNAQGFSKNEQRGIVQPFILLMQIATLAYFSKLGILTSSSLKLYLLCAPAVIVGTRSGLRVFGRIGETAFRRIVLVFLLISGASFLF